MRIECEQCRALVEPTWTVTGSDIVARCPACDHASRATGAAGTAGATAPVAADGDAVECPKCGLRPVTGEACARCGLATSRMATWAGAEAPSDALALAWEDCRAHWDDPAKHDRAASLALTLGEQPWLARQYRGVLRDRPADAIAAARLERTGKIAQAAVFATATSPRAGGYRRGSSMALLAVLALIVAGGLLWGLYMVRQRASTDGAKPSATSPPTGDSRPKPPARTPARTPAPR